VDAGEHELSLGVPAACVNATDWIQRLARGR
jgi:hypothetical protein